MGEEAAMATRSEALSEELHSFWYRAVDLWAPFRPALHGYCRRLTGDLWDSEDLVQETLLRAFGQLGLLNHGITNPRAYLLRIATNLWIDELRRRGHEQPTPPEHMDALAAPRETGPEESDLRAAGARLQRLSPQERAAVLLREMFELSLAEIAELLDTTVGAVKAALHRGRDRLREPDSLGPRRRAGASPELLDRWIERYRARDLPGMAALLLEDAVVENLGLSLQYGRDFARGSKSNTLYYVLHGHGDWPERYVAEEARYERAELDGEWLLLGIVRHRGKERLQVPVRIEERDGGIARMRFYGFCPETVRELGERLGMRVWTGLYRPPDPEPAP